MNVQNTLQDRQVYIRKTPGIELKSGTPTAFINWSNKICKLINDVIYIIGWKFIDIHI